MAYLFDGQVFECPEINLHLGICGDFLEDLANGKH
jgi:hypothetical protein